MLGWAPLQLHWSQALPNIQCSVGLLYALYTRSNFYWLVVDEIALVRPGR